MNAKQEQVTIQKWHAIYLVTAALVFSQVK